MKIDVYSTKDGKQPFTEWFSSLKDHTAKAAIRKRLMRIETDNSLGDWKPIEGDLIELRLHQGPGYRLYCGIAGKTLMILLCGNHKSAQQQKDIKKAKEYWHEYKS